MECDLSGVQLSLPLREELDQPRWWEDENRIEKYEGWSGCGLPTKVHLVGPDSASIWVNPTCSLPWCPDCEPSRCNRIRMKIGRWINHWQPENLFMVTISTKPGWTFNSTWNKFNGAKRNLRKSDTWREHVRYMGVNEIKRTSGGQFNLHQHRLIQTSGPWLPFKEMGAAWKKAAGRNDAHFQVARNPDTGDYLISPEAAKAYLSKYLSKDFWGGLSRLQAFRFATGLRNRHRTETSHGSHVPNESEYVICCSDPDRFCNQGFLNPL